MGEPTPHADGHVLASSLAPALSETCGGRLGPVQWFQSTWQRGGAATGFARWRDGDREIDAFIKLPVGPVEYRWTTHLAAPLPGENGDWSHLPTPRVLASGTTLNGYDLGWLVVERLDGQTLSKGWSKDHLDHLLHAVAILHARALAVAPVTGAPANTDWETLLHRARELAHELALPEAQLWNDTIRKVQKHLPTLADRWAKRPINTWCHGDVHPGNAMRRHPTGRGDPAKAAPCVLVDLALVHPGHWVEDAVYLERQFWGRPDQLFGVHPVSALAKFRRELGLRTDGDYGALANIRRVLMAAVAPCYYEQEGHPRYLHAALETLDRLLPQVAR